MPTATITTVSRIKVPKCFQAAAEAAWKAGWTLTITGGNHIEWKPADPKMRIVYTAKTPSDKRVLKNAISDLRKSGLTI